MATKTPSKGKKATAEKAKSSAPKKSRAAKAAPVEPKEADPPELEESHGGEDDDEDDEEEAAAARPATPAKKPAAPGRPAAKGAVIGEDAPQVVPARRLTPEAKAKINELVAKGMPLPDALRAAGAWETFVAPVREDPAKLAPGGRSFEGGGRPPARPRNEDSDNEERDEEPAPSGGDDD